MLGAIVAVLFFVLFVVAVVLTLRDSESIDSVVWAIAFAVVRLVEAVLLGWGSIALFRRGARGPVILAAGCGASILFSIMAFMRTLISDDQLNAGQLAGSGAVSVILAIFPIATMILALLPATRRWVAAPR
ncbi:hypothetical protein [Williamsia sp. CHRR-6]|uniref:hypothetical protein n=1 Tax=Williamsia sp. CHRR-6 TaxID=2835871 RepID=UPI001BDB6A59|nr:hypothetical protein [Williamsia sp. CHRR-6]MBT0566307.1 hypothetical protein [Williamsia sp. CHRR-6]